MTESASLGTTNEDFNPLSTRCRRETPPRTGGIENLSRDSSLVNWWTGKPSEVHLLLWLWFWLSSQSWAVPSYRNWGQCSPTFPESAWGRGSWQKRKEEWRIRDLIWIRNIKFEFSGSQLTWVSCYSQHTPINTAPCYNVQCCCAGGKYV